MVAYNVYRPEWNSKISLVVPEIQRRISTGSQSVDSKLFFTCFFFRAGGLLALAVAALCIINLVCSCLCISVSTRSSSRSAGRLNKIYCSYITYVLLQTKLKTELLVCYLVHHVLVFVGMFRTVNAFASGPVEIHF